MTKRLWSIDLSYACFGIVEAGGRVKEAANIAGWTTGKSIDYVLSYYRRKGAKIEECPKLPE